MASTYSNKLKQQVCHKICDNRKSTSKVAKELNIPVKTVEKWVTAYNKNPEVFNCEDKFWFMVRKCESHRYDHLTKTDLKNELKKRDSEIEYLKSLMKLEV